MFMPCAQLVALLEAEFGMLGVRAFYWGHRCNDLVIPLYFDQSALTGDLPLLEMNTTNLIADTGNGWSYFRVTDNQQGGFHLYQPGGDFFRTKSEQMEVEVRRCLF